MSQTLPVAEVELGEQMTQEPKSEQRRWRSQLAVLGAASFWVYAWNIWNGARSEYYASIAMSMSKSWSNLWFGAADPGGTITLDKIPGSYWLPALSVKLFGFSTWAIILPNAIATAAAAILVAKAARHWLTPRAALLAGALFALTPIVAAVARSNQPQSFFVLALALAFERGAAALKTGRTRTLVSAGLAIALAFHAYMLEAWAVWPALGLAWLVAAPLPLKQRIRSLLLAGFTSLAASLVWIISVTVTPAASRPFIGGTYGNSAWEMVFGYNGLGRFGSSSSGAYRSFTPPFSGSPGLFRLYNDQLIGQIGWLLPIAFIALAGLVFAQLRGAVDMRGLLWFAGGWLVVFTLMFDVVAGMHQFYTSALAPAIAVLVAAGADAALAQDRRTNRLVTFTVMFSAVAWALYVASRNGWYMAGLIGLQAAAALGVLALLDPSIKGKLRNFATPLLAVALVATPAAWAVDSMSHPSSINPVAGPQNGGFGGGPQGGGFGGPPGGFGAGNQFGVINGSSNSALTDYLKAGQNGSYYVAAFFGQQAAAPYITATGDNYLGIGGFDGSDPAPTLGQVKQWVQDGTLRQFVFSGGGVGRGGMQGGFDTSDIAAWVQSNCQSQSDAPASVYRCS